MDQSKRLAKRAAANAMLSILRSLPADMKPGLINKKKVRKVKGHINDLTRAGQDFPQYSSIILFAPESLLCLVMI